MSNHPTEDPHEGKPNPNGGNNDFFGLGPQRLSIIVVVFLIFAAIVFFASQNQTPSSNMSITDLVRDIKAGRVTEILVKGGAEIVISYVPDEGSEISPRRSTYIDYNDNLITTLIELGVTPEQLSTISIQHEPGDQTGAFILQAILTIVPILIIVWFIWRMMRNVRSGQDQALNFGRSRARVSRDMERPQVTFDDVAGAEEAKEDLKEVVEFLKEPEKFIRLGARVPKGVLMVGPPGTGKTLMARAVAGEAGAPFFSISGSEFVEMFVGVGASRVRDLFERAKAEAPAIIFIDEIDAVGRQRGAGLGGGHDEREQTLNQILVEMDGFENDTNVIIIAATNRPDILDPALMRPGRFDRKVMMDNPDVKGREDILKVHVRGKPLGPDVDIKSISKITAGFSGADLENLVNEAAILAARRNKKSIAMSEMQEAMERVVMGPERRSRVISSDQKRKTAYHEAGHAIVSHLIKEADPVHKITIVSRGNALGYVMPLRDEDQWSMSSTQMEARIAMLMGGRAAEEIIFGQFYTGAMADIQQATRLARMMVTQFGMSEKLGPRAYGAGSQPVFMGRDLGESRDYSEEYAEQIDNEVKHILEKAYQRAKVILNENRDTIENLVNILMERETLDRTEFTDIMNGNYKLPSFES